MYQDKQIQNYIYNTRNKLGEGSFGEVYAGINSLTNERIAIKILKKAEIDKDYYLQQGLANEIKIMKSLQSENIVKLIDQCQSTDNYYLIQEYCGGGDLQKYIRKSKHLTESKAKEILIQILNGFQELIKYGIMHRDLKPANILIHENKFKIADFGLSKSVPNLNLLQQSCVGTPFYMSPQLLEKQMYTSKADIWALGVLYYYMLYGKYPWKIKTQADLIKKIRTEQIQFPSDIKVSTDSKNFILCCLQISESQRMSWQQLFRHTLVKSHFFQIEKVTNNLNFLINDLKHTIICKKLTTSQLFPASSRPDNKIHLDQLQDFLVLLHPNANHVDIEYLYNQLRKQFNDFIYLTDLSLWFIQNNIVQDTLPNNIQIRPSYTDINLTEPAITQVIERLRGDRASFKELFKKIDKSGDGQLDYAELRDFALTVNRNFNEIQIQTIFIYFDINKDGYVTLKEFEDQLIEDSDLDLGSTTIVVSKIHESIDGPGQKLEVIQRPFLLKKFTN